MPKGTFEGINLNLINEQLLGTGDNPESGFANCAAFGLRKKEQIILGYVDIVLGFCTNAVRIVHLGVLMNAMNWLTT